MIWPCQIQLLHFAGNHGGIDVGSNQTEPNSTRPNSGKSDALHAHHFFHHVLFLPRRIGVVLGSEQHIVDCAAVADQQDDY